MPLHYWLAVASALSRVGALAHQVDESCLVFHEVELPRSRRPVAMLRDAEVDRLSGRFRLVDPIGLAPKEDHDVRILLDRARLPQVGESRLLRVAHLCLTRELAECQHRNAKLSSERLAAQISGQRLLTSVFLVKALGGDWPLRGQRAPKNTSRDELPFPEIHPKWQK